MSTESDNECGDFPVQDMRQRIARLEAELARLLEPSPCGKGHTRADWVDGSPVDSPAQVSGQREIIAFGHCRACAREAEKVALATAAAFEAAQKIVLDAWIEGSVTPEQFLRVAGHIASKIKQLTPASAAEAQKQHDLKLLREINTFAEADMLKGNPVTGAHHRAIEQKLAQLESSLAAQKEKK